MVITSVKERRMATKCPVCNQKETIPIFKKRGLPKYVLEIHTSRENALNAKRGDVDFYFCLGCQFAFNNAFDPSLMDYLVDYESSRTHSEYFNEYLYSVCRDINDVFPVTDKTVVEIGCGDGHLLIKLRELFEFEGWGFEPSLSRTQTKLMHKDLKFVEDYYNSDILKKQPDLIILRHILEHQGEVHDFIENILAKQNVTPYDIYIEVPAWEWIVDHDQIYAFSYEHCSYFSKNSLSLALELHGCKCKRLSSAFEDEYFQYFGTKSTSNEFNQDLRTETSAKNNHEYQESVISRTHAFIDRIPTISERLRTYFEEFKNTVLWGAAGKGAMLLNVLDITYQQVPYIVDSNPRRHNTYIPVTGQQVVGPELLKKIKPQYILLTNPSYIKEVKSQLHHLGVKAKINVVK